MDPAWYTLLTLIAICIISAFASYYRGAYHEAKEALTNARSDLRLAHEECDIYRRWQTDLLNKYTAFTDDEFEVSKDFTLRQVQPK